MPDTLDVQQGNAVNWLLTLRDASGRALTNTYSGSEALALKVWAGDDQPLQSLPSGSGATWDNASAGTVAVTITSADSATLPVGWWRVEVELTTGGQVLTIFRAMLEVLPQPGSATPGPIYGALDDVRRVAPWIDRLITESPAMQSTLREYLTAARRRLDDYILARYRPLGRTGWDGQYVRLDEPYPMWPVTGGTDAYLREQLDADRLMVAGGRGAIVREITARLAVAMLCESQLGTVTGTESTYQATSARYYRQAAALMAGYVAEIDTNGDGTADIRIPLGVASAR